MDTSQLLKQITSYVDSGIPSSLRESLPSLIKSLVCLLAFLFYTALQTMEQQQEAFAHFLEGDMPNKYSIALILMLCAISSRLISYPIFSLIFSPLFSSFSNLILILSSHPFHTTHFTSAPKWSKNCKRSTLKQFAVSFVLWHQT